MKIGRGHIGSCNWTSHVPLNTFCLLTAKREREISPPTFEQKSQVSLGVNLDHLLISKK